MSSRKRKSAPRVPLVRVRSMAVVLALIAAFIAVPLLLVWKQAFITSSSMKLEKMSDTLSVMNKKIATLKLTSDRLSANDRIESIAREALGLEFPSSDRIAILPEKKGTSAHSIALRVQHIWHSLKTWFPQGGAR
ncbi:MAG: cell division protein FtsL [Chitinispirillaceae bacterium]|nr:cell division protein FtsL [Chitinispirillaceae bacterium]